MKDLSIPCLDKTRYTFPNSLILDWNVFPRFMLIKYKDGYMRRGNVYVHFPHLNWSFILISYLRHYFYPIDNKHSACEGKLTDCVNSVGKSHITTKLNFFMFKIVCTIIYCERSSIDKLYEPANVYVCHYRRHNYYHSSCERSVYM